VTNVTGSVADLAGNQATATATVRLDRTPPVVTLTGIPKTPACSTTDAGSGVATPAVLQLVTVRVNGIPMTTATCSGASDTVGNVTPSMVFPPYVAPIQFSGFQSPVDGPPVINTGKGGRGYPIKFQLRDAEGQFISALPAVTATTFAVVSCTAFSGTSDALPTLTAGASSLQYDTTSNQYTYVWKTPSKTACYRFRLTLADGASYTANFNLK
jgi:hypothetical protein